MNKNILIGVLVVILIAGGIYLFMQNKNYSPNVPSGTVGTPESVSAPLPPPVRLPPPPIPPAQGVVTSAVIIQNFAFNKPSITIKKGGTIVWTNKDSAGHTVTGDVGGPSSQTIPTNGTYSYTFNSVGTFTYHCAIHPSMKGTVIVTQ